jgi:hypothetical protein
MHRAFIDHPVYQHGGCCWYNPVTKDYVSTPAKYDPYCVSGNPEYRLVTVDDQYYVRYFEALDLFDNGIYERWTKHENKNYHPDSTDYCELITGYFSTRKFSRESGKHDFNPGSNHIKFTSIGAHDALDPSEAGGGWAIASGEILYTCKSLIITFPFNNQKWSVVYRKHKDIWNPLQTYFPEFYE